MATLAFFNFAATTLAGPISNVQTTCNVAAGSGALFPLVTGQYFKMVFLDAATKLVREVVNVTAVNGDTLTIVRAQEGTTASNYAAGDIAANLITAGSFAAFAQLGNLPSNFVQGTDSGTSANTVVVATTTPVESAPSPGQVFLITKSTNGNTGPVTFQIASGTAYSVVYKDGTALGPGAWPGGAAAFLYFTGGIMQFVACEPAPVVRFHSATDTGTADAIVLAPTPAVAALTDNTALLFVKGTSPNATTTPTIAVSGQPATVVTRLDGSALAPYDLPANAEIPVKYVPATNQFRVLWPVTPAQVRRKLSGDQQLYVRADGSDSNTGLANTPSQAFKTVQGCWNAVFGLYDPAGYTLYINVNVGTGVANTFDSPSFGGYTGRVVLTGDATYTTLGTVTVPAGGANLTVQNMILNFPGTGTEPPVEATISCSAVMTIGNNVTFNNNSNKANLYEVFVTGSGAQVVFADLATITVTGSGTRQAFVTTSNNASIRCAIAGNTVTFKSIGTITYTGAFTEGYTNSTQAWNLANFSGFTASGNRATSDGGCQIVLGGVTLPGSSGPSTPTHGGQIY